MRTPIAVVVIVAILVLGVLVVAQREGSGPSGRPPEGPPLMLQAYDVPDGRQEPVRDLLNRLLAQGDKRIGRAEVASGGRIVVAAPPALHGGMATLVSKLSEGAEAGPASVGIDYWLLAGRPSAAASAAPAPDLEGAVKAIAEAAGPMGLEVVERLRLVSSEGEHATARGASTEVVQRVEASGKDVIADVELRLFGAGQVKTRLRIPSGQTVVLAQSGYQPKEAAPGDTGRTIFYVCRATVAGS